MLLFVVLCVFVVESEVEMREMMSERESCCVVCSCYVVRRKR